MSMPVTISVTQCSTCTRVFISRKKYSPSCEQPLDGAGRAVAHRPGRLGADLADPLAQLGVHRRGGALLDQLLVAALHRAVALEQVDHVALGVGQHLHLHVAWIGQVALHVHGGVGEELLALARGALERLLELVLGLGHAEALAAAAAGRLDGHRVADRRRRSPCAHPPRWPPGRWCRARSARRPPSSARGPWSWSPWRRWRRPAGPRRRCPPPRTPGRRPRSPRGTRTRDGSASAPDLRAASRIFSTFR